MQIRKQLRRLAFTFSQEGIPSCCLAGRCSDGYHGLKTRVRHGRAKSHPGRGTTPRHTKKGGQG